MCFTLMYRFRRKTLFALFVHSSTIKQTGNQQTDKKCVELSYLVHCYIKNSGDVASTRAIRWDSALLDHGSRIP
jgi:hypothetical protein